MIVDSKHHRFFVARRGQVLRDIADEYGGVIVSFPRTASQSDKVTLKGAKDCVEAAKKRMLEMIEDLVSRCNVYPAMHQCNANLRQLQLCCFKEVTDLHVPLNLQDAQVTVECVIPQKCHRSIMGPKGSRIQQITKDHNVQIKFPDREDQQGKYHGEYQ